jgi:hypothetical protein
MSGVGWHRFVTAAITVSIACCGALVAGCDSGTPSSAADSEQPTVPGSPTTPDAASAPPPTTPPPTTPPRPSSGSAGTPTATGVANALFPLNAGFQSVRRGFVTKGSRRLPHRRVFTVTDVSKQVDGVRAVIALDQDFDGGELAEQSLELLALDADGGVRYLGSYTETYEGGQFVNSTDAWLSGSNGARSGILVPASPRVGAPSFTEAVVPGEPVATARVVRAGERKCVPFRCFTDVVVIEEGGSELKYYAPGAGGILTEPLSGDPQETEELVNVTSLSAQGLAEVSAEVLRLDAHARSVSRGVFANSGSARRGT